MNNAAENVKYRTIYQLLEILHELNPIAAERERQAFGMTVPEDSADFGNAITDILESIEDST